MDVHVKGVQLLALLVRKTAKSFPAARNWPSVGAPVLNKPRQDKRGEKKNQEVNKQETPDNKHTTPEEPEMKNLPLPPTSP